MSYLRNIALTLNILFTFPLLCLEPSSGSYYFKQISLEEGLSQSRVQCILRDKQGIIWIGTKQGLNSFDQFNLRTYTHDRNNENSLPDNFIRFIAEDQHSLLYISTNKGVFIYDKIKKNYTPIIYENKVLQAWSFFQIDDKIIFGGKNEMLYSYNCTTKKLERCTKPENDKIDRIYKIQPWLPRQLIYATKKNGIWIFDSDTKQTSPYLPYRGRDINTIYVDSKNRLWISIYNEGIICYDKKGQLVKKINSLNSELNNDIVFDFLENNNQLWLATDGGGINIYDFESGKISFIKNVSDGANTLPYNSIYCLYKDSEENVWIGSVRGGLFGVKKVFLKTYNEVPLNNHYGLSERAVVSLYQEESDQLWIGTDGGGLNRYNAQKEDFIHYPSTFNKKVTSISPYSQNKLLISCFNDGIYFFNKKNGQLSTVNFLEEEIIHKEFSYGDLVTLFTKNQNVFVFGHTTYSYNRTTKQTEYVTTPDIEIFRKAGLRVIAHTDSVAYLMGTNDVFKLSFEEKKISILFSLPLDIELTAGCQDDKGTIWVGTNIGLYSFHEKNSKLMFIETNLFDNVTHLAKDDKGRLWIGGQNMLFVYIIAEKRFVILGESDGMSANELIFSPSCSISGKYLFMGGNRGLVRINTAIKFEKTAEPQIKISDISLDGISIFDKIKNNRLKIPWNHSSIRIRIFVKEKDMFRKHAFRYYVSENKAKFIETYDNSLNLGKLQSAKHTILVACNTQSGEWSQPQQLLTIIVPTPWWRSWWFITLIMLSATYLIWHFIKNRIKKKENRLKWEMKEYENKTYEEKIRFLINISHELRTPLTLIYAPLKRLIDKEKIPEPVNEELKNIFRQTLQMKDTIDMVLDMRKMEVGETTLHLSNHNYNEWIENLAELFRSELAKKDIELVFNFDKTITTMSFDENKCKIVFSNFMMNALKFSLPYTRVTVATERKNDVVRTLVSDQGIGLQNIDTKKLFTRFYQGNHNKGGSGIGLSYAKKLIESQGGIIGAENNKAGGALFFFDLPIVCINDEEDTENKKDYLFKSQTHTTSFNNLIDEDIELSKYSILIAEDEPNLRLFIEKNLKDFFHRVFPVNNGEEALEIIRKYTPDIVLSDVMMPHKDGFQLCKEMKEDVSISHIPVVLLTAYTDPESTIAGYKLGADAYLAKPFDVDILISVLQNQISKRESVRRRYLNGQLISINETTFSSADEKFMMKLNRIIEDEFSNTEFGIQDLIDKMAMSRTSLYDKLKEITSLGVNDYINRMRIEAAMHLLTNTDMNITEISEKVGFNYQRHFSSLFKKIVGISPSRYKNNHKKAVSDKFRTDND